MLLVIVDNAEQHRSDPLLSCDSSSMADPMHSSEDTNLPLPLSKTPGQASRSSLGNHSASITDLDYSVQEGLSPHRFAESAEIQDYETLRKEAFNLKLKVYFLEEKLYKSVPEDYEQVIQDNLRNKVLLAEKAQELEDRNLLLLKARHAIDTLQADLELLRTERVADRQRCEDQSKTLQCLQTQNSSLQNELETRVETVKESETAVSSLREQIKTMLVAQRGLEEELKSEQQRFAELEALAHHQNLELEERTSALEHSENRAKAAEAQKRGLEEKLQGFVTDNQLALKNLQERLHDREVEVADLQRAVAAFQAERTQLEKMRHDLEAEMKKALLEGSAVSQELSSVEASKKALDKRLQEQELRVRSLSEELSAERENKKHLGDRLRLLQEAKDQALHALEEMKSHSSKEETTRAHTFHSLKSRLQEVESAYEEVCDDKARLQEAARNLEARLQSANHQAELLKDRASSLEAELRTTSESERALRSRYGELEASARDSLDAERQLRTEREAKDRAAMAVLQAREVELSTALELSQSQAQARISELTRSEQSAQQLARQAQAEVQDLRSRVQSLEKDLRQHMATAGDVQRECDLARGQVSNLQKVVELKSTEMARLRDENLRLSKQIAEAGTRVSSVEDSSRWYLEKEIAKANAAEQELSKVKDVLAETESTRNILESLLHFAGVTADKSTGKPRPLQHQVQALEEMISAHRQNSGDLQTRICVLEEKNRAASTVVESLKQELEDARKQEARLKADVRSLEEQLREVSSDKARTFQRATEMKLHAETAAYVSENEKGIVSLLEGRVKQLSETNRMLILELEEARAVSKRRKQQQGVLFAEVERLKHALQMKESDAKDAAETRTPLRRDDSRNSKQSGRSSLGHTTGSPCYEVVVLRQVNPDTSKDAHNVVQKTRKALAELQLDMSPPHSRPSPPPTGPSSQHNPAYDHPDHDKPSSLSTVAKRLSPKGTGSSSAKSSPPASSKGFQEKKEKETVFDAFSRNPSLSTRIARSRGDDNGSAHSPGPSTPPIAPVPHTPPVDSFPPSTNPSVDDFSALPAQSEATNPFGRDRYVPTFPSYPSSGPTAPMATEMESLLRSLRKIPHSTSSVSSTSSAAASSMDEVKSAISFAFSASAEPQSLQRPEVLQSMVSKLQSESRRRTRRLADAVGDLVGATTKLHERLLDSNMSVPGTPNNSAMYVDESIHATQLDEESRRELLDLSTKGAKLAAKLTKARERMNQRLLQATDIFQQLSSVTSRTVETSSVKPEADLTLQIDLIKRESLTDLDKVLETLKETDMKLAQLKSRCDGSWTSTHSSQMQ